MSDTPAPKKKGGWKPKAPLPPLAEGEVRILSGGNPQIPKGDGDGPVQAYIAAMPGWKQAVGVQIDALIVQMVPEVAKAVKWNTPFYGIGKKGWFLGFSCLNRYIKVAFFQGAHLHPLPPVQSTQADVRYLHLHEGEELDVVQFSDWVLQSTKLPLEKL